jgi:hypothetical protein
MKIYMYAPCMPSAYIKKRARVSPSKVRIRLARHITGRADARAPAAAVTGPMF